MSSNYEQHGRTSQKSRTREALLAATRSLLADGQTPTVEDAAASASVSRATAYRYFPNALSLLRAAHPEMDASTMLPSEASDDPAERLDAVVTSFTEMIVRTEAQQRAMLRLSLESDPGERGALPLRQGRAIGWFLEALEGVGVEMSEGELRRLVYAVRATTGIEALVWLTDIAGLTRTEAVALMRWTAQAILERSLHTPPPTSRAGMRKKAK
ncbi:MAG: TetR/AcrR family transcriptional regulator [Ilumatobacteraceae bacterium]